MHVICLFVHVGCTWKSKINTTAWANNVLAELTFIWNECSLHLRNWWSLDKFNIPLWFELGYAVRVGKVILPTLLLAGGAYPQYMSMDLCYRHLNWNRVHCTRSWPHDCDKDRKKIACIYQTVSNCCMVISILI